MIRDEFNIQLEDIQKGIDFHKEQINIHQSEMRHLFNKKLQLFELVRKQREVQQPVSYK